MFFVKTIILLSFISFSSLLAQEYSQIIKNKKIYPMGEKIYNKKCKNIDIKKYKTLKDMQKSIKSEALCQALNSKYFEALSLYLWEVKRTQNSKKENIIEVSKKEKCPICGMFVYKYPQWVTQIFYKNNHYSFDGMKDLMKFYLKKSDGIEKILVRDYYSQNVIEAREAFFVIGSDIYGPMGEELIALQTQEEAKDFKRDHFGKSILEFSEITQELMNSFE